MNKPDHWYKSPALQNLLSVAGHAVSGILVVAAKNLSWPGFLVSSFSVTGVLIAKDRAKINASEKQLLNLYGDKIATLLHKDESQLTMDDLYTAARTKDQGGLGITTLCRQVDKFENFRTIKTTGRIASMAIIGAGVLAVSLIYGPAAFSGFTALSIMGIAATAISKTVEAVTDAMIERKDEGRVTQQVMDIAQRIKTTGISPLQVLDVFVKARPELQQEISAKYGNYNDLVAYQKIAVVKGLEPRLHIAGLTDAINKGTIKPNLLGLVAYNDNFAELPDYRRYQALANAPMPPVALPVTDSATSTQHVDKLLAQAKEPQARTVH